MQESVLFCSIELNEKPKISKQPHVLVNFSPRSSWLHSRPPRPWRPPGGNLCNADPEEEGKETMKGLHSLGLCCAEQSLLSSVSCCS